MTSVLPLPTIGSNAAPEATSDNHSRYVLFGEADASTFDVQPKDKTATGPSPYAFEAKGPSVLNSWAPKKSTGKFDSLYKFTEETPDLGRTYYGVDLREVLENDELLEDLAVIISERGVVYFKDQHKLSIEQQKQFTHKIGLAAGKPKGNGLHIHPIALSGGLIKDAKIDPEVFLASSRLIKKLYPREQPTSGVYQPTGGVRQDPYESNWHSDITFEPAPADFSTMRLLENPSGSPTAEELAKPGGGRVGGAGGDTLWASGYALAERISPKLLAFLETLTGEYSQPMFKDATSKHDVPLYTAPRGAVENIGDELIAYHPVVRTNPTTGWKSIFALGGHFRKFVGLSQTESDILKDYLLRVLQSTPEIQVRHRWEEGDLAIWDNRSTYHSAVFDLYSVEGAVRTGLRNISVGERPFLDPTSKLRYEALSERLGSN